MLSALGLDLSQTTAMMVGATGCSGRLDCMVDHCKQLDRERVQVHLVAKSVGERLDGLGGVEPMAVEATIHSQLDAVASRLEQCATAKVALATAQLGGFPATPPNSCPNSNTTAAYTDPRMPVSSPYTRVRRMSRSMSYSR